MIKEDVSPLTYYMTHRTVFHIIIRTYKQYNTSMLLLHLIHIINKLLFVYNLIKISKQYDTIDESLNLKFILLFAIYLLLFNYL